MKINIKSMKEPKDCKTKQELKEVLIKRALKAEEDIKNGSTITGRIRKKDRR